VSATVQVVASLRCERAAASSGITNAESLMRLKVNVRCDRSPPWPHEQTGYFVCIPASRGCYVSGSKAGHGRSHPTLREAPPKALQFHRQARSAVTIEGVTVRTWCLRVFCGGVESRQRAAVQRKWAGVHGAASVGCALGAMPGAPGRPLAAAHVDGAPSPRAELLPLLLPQRRAPSLRPGNQTRVSEPKSKYGVLGCINSTSPASRWRLPSWNWLDCNCCENSFTHRTRLCCAMLCHAIKRLRDMSGGSIHYKCKAGASRKSRPAGTVGLCCDRTCRAGHQPGLSSNSDPTPSPPRRLRWGHAPSCSVPGN